MKDCDFIEMSTNQNRIHVLVRLVKQLPSSAVKSIYDSVLAHFESTCCDKNGICLVKAFLESQQEGIGTLRSRIIDNAFVLSADPYGNYAIQKLIEVCPASIEQLFQAKLLPDRFKDMCASKFSSNVVDKMLELANEL